jgi:hypothetical protein
LGLVGSLPDRRDGHPSAWVIDAAANATSTDRRCRATIVGMELRHLRTIAAVARTGSFTKAGEELHLAQSAISQQRGLWLGALRGSVASRG